MQFSIIEHPFEVPTEAYSGDFMTKGWVISLVNG